MSDLISRQAAIANAISGRTREVDGEKWIRVSEVRESIKILPSAEPKHGKWIKADSQQYFRKHYPCFTCSECGYRKDSQKTWNYCPNCGARMDEE